MVNIGRICFRKILNNTFFVIFIITITGLLITGIVFSFELVPGQEKSFTYFPDSNFITSSLLDIRQQDYNMCGGFSAAFILQHYGFPVQGEESYREMAFNLPLALGIPPYRLVKYFNYFGMNANLYTGNLNNLKFHIAEGRPVIVLIGEGLRWQHYMVLMGYDNDGKILYFYDPERPQASVNNLQFINRALNFDEFNKLWANKLPVYNHVYIPVYYES